MYKKRTQGWLKHWDFILLDMICLQLAFVAAFWLRHGFFSPYHDHLYRNMAVLLELVDVVVIGLFDTLRNVLKRKYQKEIKQTVKHCIIVGLAGILYLFVIQEGQNYSRIILFLTIGIYFILTFTFRTLLKLFLRKHKTETGKRTLLIVTTSDIAAEVIENIRGKDFSVLKISGLAIVDKDITGEAIDGVPVVCYRSDLINYVCRQWVDEVFVISSAEYIIPGSLIKSLSRTGVVIHLNITEFRDSYGAKQQVEKLGKYTVLTSTMNVMTPIQAFTKRAMDILGGFVGSLITCILFIFLAPAIYSASPGPVFFCQVRIGQNGRKFKMYKFRSMYPDADKRKQDYMQENRVKDGLMFKLDFDPRIIGNKISEDGTKKTGIGEFIRRTSLDEFPQFFNVLKGDMSLVGTRPPTEDEWEKYKIHHRARMAAKPGITGLWQVSGRSDIFDFEEVVKLDTKYINEWSIWLDIKILFKTVKSVLGRKGAI